MKDFVFKLIDQFTEGVDTYHNNGSIWLIFTDEKKWVIELTKEGTLWYNFYFFKDCFKYLSLDVVENQHFITEWVESIIQNGVRYTPLRRGFGIASLESIIQNGVRSTDSWAGKPFVSVESVIQNGVKNTEPDFIGQSELIENTIQNGVKNTKALSLLVSEDTIQDGVMVIDTVRGVLGHLRRIKNTIQNGVKETSDWRGPIGQKVEDTIQNGVIDTFGVDVDLNHLVEDTIQNGVKHTEPGGYLGSIEMKGKIVHQLESPKQNEEVEDVIENGVRNTDWRALPMTRSVEDTIQNGIKETKKGGFNQHYDMFQTIEDGIKEVRYQTIDAPELVNDVIQNGVKRTVSYKDRPEPTVEGVIQSGIKETKQEPSQRTWKIGEVIKETHDDAYHHNARVDGVIRKGIKETKSPGDGDLLTTLEWMGYNNAVSVPEMIQDVITNSIKNTQPHVLEILNPINFEPTFKENKRLNEVNNVLNKGIKEVKELPDQSGDLKGYRDYYNRQEDRTYPHKKTVNDVIRDGIKETNWRKVDNFPEFEERVIQNGIKETWGYERQPQQRVDQVIEQGTKENPSL